MNFRTYFCAAVYCFFLCAFPSFLSAQGIVRVKVIDDASGVTLKTASSLTIVAPRTKELFTQVSVSGSLQVSPHFSGVKFGRKLFKIYGIHLIPKQGKDICLNDKCFKGEIEIIRKANNTLMVVNWIDIEEYLKGVVPAEIPHWWPKEALRAQAVISRTFVLWKLSAERLPLDFDLSADVSAQVYGGKNLERKSSDSAVDDTRSQILTYQGQIFPTFYHSCCGGFTVAASNFWNVDSIPPLGSVVCEWCQESPHYRWKKEFPLDTFLAEMKAYGYNLSPVEKIIVSPDTEKKYWVAISSQNKRFKMDSYRFRLKLGDTFLKSPQCDILLRSSSIVTQGSGWGHGVGLCQWGAKGMAESGVTYKKILEAYYPKSEITLFTPLLQESCGR